MGNCSLKGVTGECSNSIRVLTDAGEIIDIKGPKLAREIANSFPGYAVCRRGQASLPLPEDECLVNGGFYYLLPMEKVHKSGDTGVCKQVNKEAVKKLEVDWMNRIEPPKMSSADFVENLSSGSALEVLPSQKNGVWKVKLVISSQQLEDILSEQVNTEALIEKMRMAAASSATLTPKRSKSSWVVGWKPALSNVFKVPIDNKVA
ncbi:hypothetical protein QUC31_009100 [Theobroma cacao]|uniref:Uncharacterized protein LOC18606732 n=1 Tax=Theobroma cacao TaxID=3641 RepID=A0AB32VCG9_THECC|nr:PREDICTED: uncharacterized protein LOC18606732 [Theobroma cacao]